MGMHFQHPYGEGIVEKSSNSSFPSALFVSANITLDTGSPEFDVLKVARLTDDIADFARRNNFIPLLSQGEIRILN